MSTKKELEIRKASAKDLKEFTNFFNQARDKKYSIEFFRKKLFQVPFFDEYIGYLAFNGQMPVAHFGGIPLISYFNNREVRFILLSDTVTAPNYRGIGLNRMLTEQLIHELKDQGFDFVLTFANDDSSKIKRTRYGWLLHEQIKLIQCPVFTFPLFKLFSKFSWINPYHRVFRVISGLILRPTFEFRKEDETKLWFPRTEEFIKYKSYEKNYLLKDRRERFAAWLSIEDGLVIADYELKDINLEDFLNKIKRIAILTGLHQIKFFLSHNHPDYEFWIKQGEVMNSNDLIIYPLNEKTDYCKLVVTGADRNIF